MRQILLFVLHPLSPPHSVAGQSSRMAWDFPDAKLVGSGEFTWWGYRSTQLSWHSTELRSPIKILLELTYNKSIGRNRFVDASIDKMKRIIGNRFYTSLEQQWRAHG